MRAAIDAVHEGETEHAAALAGSRMLIERGADHGRTGPIVSGRRSDSMHGVFAGARLSAGDVLHIEMSPQVNGYTARLMRPTVIGAPTSEQRDVAARLIEIQDDQLAAMRPGARANEIDSLCRDRVLAAGLRESYDNVTGYTLGYYGVWVPRSSDFTRVFLPTSTWTLEPGMVFHMYTYARGMTFSETVLITDDGAERLTTLERQLFIR
jgi:Xaa-Pro dipeptidase